MKTYGLIGKKLGHSFSPAYFEKKFATLGVEAKYVLFEVDDILEVKELIYDLPELIGLNVTIPYKKDVFYIADEVDPVARAVGSANTLKIERYGAKPFIRAYNTDVIGFENTLTPLIEGHQGLSALVLGTGGAAKAVVYVLNNLGIRYSLVSRNPKKDQLDYRGLSEDIIRENLLIINTTPVGMFPEADEVPAIPYSFLTHEHILYDLIYNPPETLFLKKGKEKGCITLNGMRMLELQADASWKIWNE